MLLFWPWPRASGSWSTESWIQVCVLCKVQCRQFILRLEMSSHGLGLGYQYPSLANKPTTYVRRKWSSKDAYPAWSDRFFVQLGLNNEHSGDEWRKNFKCLCKSLAKVSRGSTIINLKAEETRLRARKFRQRQESLILKSGPNKIHGSSWMYLFVIGNPPIYLNMTVKNVYYLRAKISVKFSLILAFAFFWPVELKNEARALLCTSSSRLKILSTRNNPTHTHRIFIYFVLPRPVTTPNYFPRFVYFLLNDR